MIRQSKASARWQGGLKDGSGTFSVESGVIADASYNFARRFESAPGTNPEELIAAALASCFSMALSGELGKVNLTADSIDTKAILDFERKDEKATVTHIHLDCTVKAPDAAKEAFQAAAQIAKANCPISRLLNANITLDARLA